ncbi:transcriptional regulator GcvA [Bordetella sp. 15P40C-2]|uniref:transcriptional regulator GcvA n=1 Tax=Bordetella sp. 15P40C-2 TaxID=2572246 RepID=UPI00132852AE|nr:transcriptional regulator GcvA [Bordetella sp. 15P40C-2]MVW70037.1 transcriptional regulator GcvA [Bordetella sp. 15P40C-2]
MNPQLPPLNPLRVFESAARHLSFTRAAQELHITQGAVSHQIRALERWLGFDLFERQARQLKLTRGGEMYAASLTVAFSQIVRATQDLVSTGAKQVLTVRGHTTLFVRWLIPLLPAFQSDHPDINVRLTASVEGVDFNRDDADVGIVYGDGPWENVHSDLLFSDELTPVMAPELAMRLPRPCTTEALLALPLLHSNRRPQHWADWIALAGATRGLAVGDMYYEDLSVIYQCAMEGLGVALGQLRYLEKDIQQGRLVAPHPLVLRRTRGYHLVCPQARADDGKIVCFRNWLLARATVPVSVAPG